MRRLITDFKLIGDGTLICSAQKVYPEIKFSEEEQI
jgi:hypothetical protein